MPKRRILPPMITYYIGVVSIQVEKNLKVIGMKNAEVFQKMVW